jgi:hypothetical protein
LEILEKTQTFIVKLWNKQTERQGADQGLVAPLFLRKGGRAPVHQRLKRCEASARSRFLPFCCKGRKISSISPKIILRA